MKPLKLHRDQLGKTQHEAATELGISKIYFGLLERGERIPSRDLALRIQDWSEGAIPVMDLLYPQNELGAAK